MSLFKRCSLGLLIIFLSLQFWRPAKNLSAEAKPQDIGRSYSTPPAVQALLTRACYDCHSDNTRYPWYAEVQPVGWWLAHHVDDGKKHLNFSRFGTYTAKRADHKLEEIAETITSGEMPMESYTWLHSEARLTAEEKKQLIDWAQALRRTLTLD